MSTRLPRGDSHGAPGFALGVLLCISTAHAAPAGVLRACASGAKPEAAGLAALQRRCPDLGSALRDLGFRGNLNPSSEERLTAASLTGLAALADRYQSGKAGAALDVSRVRGIVNTLARERAAQPRSWWDAIKEWLRSFLASDRGHSLTRLNRWLGELAVTSGALSLILYGLMLVVTIAAIWFVALELRAAGVFARQRPAGSMAPQRRTPSRIEAAAPAPALDSAPMAERPAILLRLLVEELSMRGRLRGDRHLTHRELAEQAVLDDAAQRERFSVLAGLAERLLYGPRTRSVEGVENIVNDGRDLLSQVARLSVKP